MGFCILDHLINLVFIKAAGRYNRNLLLTTGSFVTSGYIHNAVRVNVKGHLNLRDTTWCRGNAIQNEATERAVILGKLALTLQDINFNARLAITSGREDLCFLSRDSGVALNQTREDTTKRLDTQRKWSHVQQQHVFDITSQDTSLNSGTNSHHFIRVHTTIGFAIKNAFHQHLHSRHTRLTTNEHDLVDFRGTHASIGKCFGDWHTRFLDEILNQLL